MMSLGIITIGSAILLIVGGLLIGLSGNEKENRNIGYKNQY